MSEVSKPRVLITGATGLLGRQVFRVFAEKGWQVYGLGYSRAKAPIVHCDVLQKEQLDEKFKEIDPGVVIHCAAERRPDRLEGKDDYAKQINGEVTRSLANICEERKIWMIYISTNYVFDGKDAPYAEDAKPNPLSTYGQSKLDGEIALLSIHPNSAIVRVPVLYGPLEYLGESSVTALLDSVLSGEKPKFDNWQERFPTSSEDVADVLEAFCDAYVARGESSRDDFAGVFHWQANQVQTKYTMAVTLAEIAEVSSDHFIRNDAAPPPGSAPRPQFERMGCSRIEKMLGIESDLQKFRTDFKEALARYIKPFLAINLRSPTSDEQPELSRDESSSESKLRGLSTASQRSLYAPVVSRASGILDVDLGSQTGAAGSCSASFAQIEFDGEASQKVFETHVHEAVAVDG